MWFFYLLLEPNIRLCFHALCYVFVSQMTLSSRDTHAMYCLNNRLYKLYPFDSGILAFNANLISQIKWYENSGKNTYLMVQQRGSKCYYLKNQIEPYCFHSSSLYLVTISYAFITVLSYHEMSICQTSPYRGCLLKIQLFLESFFLSSILLNIRKESISVWDKRTPWYIEELKSKWKANSYLTFLFVSSGWHSWTRGIEMKCFVDIVS